MKYMSIRMFMVAAAVGAMNLVAMANTIDFGEDWDRYNDETGAEQSLPPEVKAVVAGAPPSSEAEIATFFNNHVSTEFAASAITKYDQEEIPGRLDVPPSTQFLVATGWQWLLVGYDGKQAGTVIIQLAGDGALVPMASYDLFLENDTDKFLVTHYAVAGPVEIPPVPDGGATLALLGIAVAGLALVRRMA